MVIYLQIYFIVICLNSNLLLINNYYCDIVYQQIISKIIFDLTIISLITKILSFLFKYMVCFKAFKMKRKSSKIYLN